MNMINELAIPKRPQDTGFRVSQKGKDKWND